MARASPRKMRPSGVSSTVRPVRSNSRVPSSRSSDATAWLTVVCTTWHTSAARVNPPISATATKYSSWRISIAPASRLLKRSTPHWDKHPIHKASANMQSTMGRHEPGKMLSMCLPSLGIPVDLTTVVGHTLSESGAQGVRRLKRGGMPCSAREPSPRWTAARS